MQMRFDQNREYLVTGAFLNVVNEAMRLLYANDARRVSADTTRDIANTLYAQLPNAEILPE